jgi:hypothetical protein
MKYNKINRRMFLQGAGKTVLSIPFLPSLLPRDAWAQACATMPVRFFMCSSQWSPSPELFIGGLTANDRRSENVNIRSLTGLSNISPVIGAEFNPYLRKMSILRGIDNYGPELVSGHEYGMGASGTPCIWHHDQGNEGGRYYIPNRTDHYIPPVLNVSSIDVILSESSKVYPNGSPANRRLISLVPTDDQNLSIYDWGNATNGSWKRGVTRASADGVVRSMSSQDLYNLFVREFTGGSMVITPPPATSNTDRDVVQAVYDDYKSLRDSTQISKDDKLNLENYMSLINELIKNITNQSTQPTPTMSCTNPVPNQGSNNNNFGRWKNQVDIVTAAMACDLTRVANLQLNSLEVMPGLEPAQLHNYHHSLSGSNEPNTGGSTTANFFRQQWVNAGRKFAYVLERMNSFNEGGATLLDNSIVYWWTQHGMAQPCGTSHSDADRGIIVAGGGRGALEMGYFIDYRHVSENWTTNYRLAGRPGLPINNLLMTFLNAFAIPAAEYERPGQPGFGAYYNDEYGRWLHGLNNMSATNRNRILNMRRESLPFLFKKAAC